MASTSDTPDSKSSSAGKNSEIRSNPFIVPLFSPKKLQSKNQESENDGISTDRPATATVEPVVEQETTAPEPPISKNLEDLTPEPQIIPSEAPVSVEGQKPLQDYLPSSSYHHVGGTADIVKKSETSENNLPLGTATWGDFEKETGFSDDPLPTLVIDIPKEDQGHDQASGEQPSDVVDIPAPPNRLPAAPKTSGTTGFLSSRRVVPSRKNPEKNTSAIKNIKIGDDENAAKNTKTSKSKAKSLSQDSLFKSLKHFFALKRKKMDGLLKKINDKLSRPSQSSQPPAKKSAKPPKAKKNDVATSVPPSSRTKPNLRRRPDVPRKKPGLPFAKTRKPTSPKSGATPQAIFPEDPDKSVSIPPEKAARPARPIRLLWSSRLIHYFRSKKLLYKKKPDEKASLPSALETTVDLKPADTDLKPADTRKTTDEAVDGGTITEPPPATTIDDLDIRRSRRDKRQRTIFPPFEESVPLPLPTHPKVQETYEVKKLKEAKKSKRTEKKQRRLTKIRLTPPTTLQHSLPQTIIRKTINAAVKSLVVVTVAALLAATALTALYLNTINAMNSSTEKDRLEIYNTNLALIAATNDLKPGLTSQDQLLLGSIGSDLEEHNKLLRKNNVKAQAVAFKLTSTAELATSLNDNAHKAYDSALAASAELAGLFASISVSQYFKAQSLVEANLADPDQLSWKFQDSIGIHAPSSQSCDQVTKIPHASRKDSTLFDISLLEQNIVYLLEVEAARRIPPSSDAAEVMLFHRKQQQNLDYYLTLGCVEIPAQEPAFALPLDFEDNPRRVIQEYTSNLLDSYTYLIATTPETTSEPQTPQAPRAFAAISMFSTAEAAIKLGSTLEATPGLKP